jgi:hypothetical protein
MYQAECLAGLAAVIAFADSSASGAARAAQFLGAVEMLRGANTVVVRPAGEHDYHRAVDAVRARLGEVMHSIAWAEGQSMSMEQVAANVLVLSSEEQ